MGEGNCERGLSGTTMPPPRQLQKLAIKNLTLKENITEAAVKAIQYWKSLPEN